MHDGILGWFQAPSCEGAVPVTKKMSVLGLLASSSGKSPQFLVQHHLNASYNEG